MRAGRGYGEKGHGEKDGGRGHTSHSMLNALSLTRGALTWIYPRER